MYGNKQFFGDYYIVFAGKSHCTASFVLTETV